MPPFLQFVIRRFLFIPISLIIITMVLYGGVMLTPPESRASLYFPPKMNPNMTEEQWLHFQETIIERYRLRQDLQNPGMYLRVGRAMDARPLPPDEKANLGMLPFGFDVYHSLVWGTRDALEFGLMVTINAAVFGILYGAIAGMAGTRTSTLMLMIADAFLAFPPIVRFVLLSSSLPPRLQPWAACISLINITDRSLRSGVR